LTTRPNVALGPLIAHGSFENEKVGVSSMARPPEACPSGKTPSLARRLATTKAADAPPVAGLFAAANTARFAPKIGVFRPQSRIVAGDALDEPRCVPAHRAAHGLSEPSPWLSAVPRAGRPPGRNEDVF
jgi:hypothetical protein